MECKGRAQTWDRCSTACRPVQTPHSEPLSGPETMHLTPPDPQLTPLQNTGGAKTKNCVWYWKEERGE